MITPKEYEYKLKQVKKLLDVNKAQALLIISKPNRLWLLGNQLSFTAILVANNKSYLFVNKRDFDTYSMNKTYAEVLPYSSYKDIEKVLKTNKVKHLLIEKDQMNLIQYDEYVKPLKNIKITSVITRDLSAVKLPYELENMQVAADMACNVENYIKKWIKVGMTELEVKKEILIQILKQGAEGPSFDPIVAFGENSAEPHHRATNRKLKSSELIKIDLGCTYKGYNSDITRTYWLGKPSKLMLEIYKLVLQANKLGIKLAKTGSTGQYVDSQVREFFNKNTKYADRFIHALGHRLGLAGVRESRFGQGDNVKLSKNCTVTIEPGLYIPGFGGVRIEDDIVITDNGGKVLTNKASKEI